MFNLFKRNSKIFSNHNSCIIMNIYNFNCENINRLIINNSAIQKEYILIMINHLKYVYFNNKEIKYICWINKNNEEVLKIYNYKNHKTDNSCYYEFKIDI